MGEIVRKKFTPTQLLRVSMNAIGNENILIFFFCCCCCCSHRERFLSTARVKMKMHTASISLNNWLKWPGNTIDRQTDRRNISHSPSITTTSMKKKIFLLDLFIKKQKKNLTLIKAVETAVGVTLWQKQNKNKFKWDIKRLLGEILLCINESGTVTYLSLSLYIYSIYTLIYELSSLVWKPTSNK